MSIAPSAIHETSGDESRYGPPLTHTSSAPSHPEHSSPAVPACGGHATRALCAPLCSSNCDLRLRSASSKMSSGVQHAAAAKLPGSSMYAPAAHESSACEIRRQRNACHVMGRAMRGAGSLTRVALKAAATNGAIDAHTSCALCTRCVLAVMTGARRETDARTDSDCFARLTSGLRACTLRCGVRARVQSHHWRRDARGLQRCTRSDLTRM